VQEALTNAASHAPGACVGVRITDASRTVRIEVHNDAPASPPGHLPGACQGPHSMAARTAACGDRFEAGSSLDGGFTVTALLPREAGA
jgi:signal transduction histidine kinase